MFPIPKIINIKTLSINGFLYYCDVNHIRSCLFRQFNLCITFTIYSRNLFRNTGTNVEKKNKYRFSATVKSHHDHKIYSHTIIVSAFNIIICSTLMPTELQFTVTAQSITSIKINFRCFFFRNF